jgi:flagellar hook assembly protein FlgD
MAGLSSVLSPSIAANLGNIEEQRKQVGANGDFKQVSQGMFGAKGSPLHVDLANYMPDSGSKTTVSPTDYTSNARIDQFQNRSPIEKELKKTVESTQAMVVTYIKGRVPLGDDKFNATDMFRSILDILKAMENVQMVKMMEDGNRIALNNLFMQMPQQVGNRALVQDDAFEFQGEDNTNFAVDVPENASLTTVSLINEETGEEVRTWVLDQKGLNPLSWNGKSDENKDCAHGNYKVVAYYENSDGLAQTAPIYVTHKIESVVYDPAKNGGYPEFRGPGNRPLQNVLAVYDKAPPAKQLASGTAAIDDTASSIPDDETTEV